MKKALFSILILTSLFLPKKITAQELQITTKRQGNLVSFFAQNTHFCPYQCLIIIQKPSLLKDSSFEPFYAVIPPQSGRVPLFKVQVKDAKGSPLTYTKTVSMGDPTFTNPEDQHAYFIPYDHKKKFRIIQGYNGKFSHQRQYALDFKMPEGTPICAIRGGIVVKTRSDSNQGGKDASFANEANYVIIYHRDGTFAKYWHLKQNGVPVKVGQRVNAGDVIGFSGNTGWSTTPHLHLVVQKPVYLKLVSIPTKFLVKKNKKKYLKGWRKYKAYHPK